MTSLILDFEFVDKSLFALMFGIYFGAWSVGFILVPGFWCLELNTWNSIPIFFLVLAAWNLIRCLVLEIYYGAWYFVFGIWCLELKMVLGAWNLEF